MGSVEVSGSVCDEENATRQTMKTKEAIIQDKKVEESPNLRNAGFFFSNHNLFDAKCLGVKLAEAPTCSCGYPPAL